MKIDLVDLVLENISSTALLLGGMLLGAMLEKLHMLDWFWLLGAG